MYNLFCNQLKHMFFFTLLRAERRIVSLSRRLAKKIPFTTSLPRSPTPVPTPPPPSPEPKTPPPLSPQLTPMPTPLQLPPTSPPKIPSTSTRLKKCLSPSKHDFTKLFVFLKVK